MKQVIVQSFLIALLVILSFKGLLGFANTTNPDLYAVLVKYSGVFYVLTFTIIYTLVLKIKRSRRKA